MLVIMLTATLVASATIPPTMRGVEATGKPCTSPAWTCLSLQTVPVPKPGSGELLLEVHSSSVNPVNVDLVEPECETFPPPLGCSKGTIGSDAAGVVVAIGGGATCGHLKVGDEVWTSANGAYAEYAVATCKSTGIKPKSLSLEEAGTIPCVGVTALECLQAAGAPWSNRSMPLSANLTIAITSGQGGTGFMGIQLAKALGAKHVVTAASGSGIAMVKALGADQVFDYTKVELFDALPDNSVDVVFDNYGKPGTADKAMHAIRPGGVYLVLEGGLNGNISSHPKPFVRQIAFGFADGSDHSTGLDILAKLFDAHAFKPHTQAAFGLADIAKAFTTSVGGDVIGKLAVLPAKAKAI